VRRYFESKISEMFGDKLERGVQSNVSTKAPQEFKVKFVCTDGWEPAKRD
jgi:hypothetical protein